MCHHIRDIPNQSTMVVLTTDIDGVIEFDTNNYFRYHSEMNPTPRVHSVRNPWSPSSYPYGQEPGDPLHTVTVTVIVVIRLVTRGFDTYVHVQRRYLTHPSSGPRVTVLSTRSHHYRRSTRPTTSQGVLHVCP